MPSSRPATKPRPNPDHTLSETDAIQTLRTALRVVTDAYDEVLEDGLPPGGRGSSDRDGYVGWWEDAYEAIKRARAALSRTADYAEIADSATLGGTARN